MSFNEEMIKQVEAFCDFSEDSEQVNLHSMSEKELTDFFYSKGALIPFIKINENYTIEDVVKIFENSIKRREKVLKIFEHIYRTKETPFYKSYEQNFNKTKDCIKEYNEATDILSKSIAEDVIKNLMPLLLEAEIQMLSQELFLINYDENIISFIGYNSNITLEQMLSDD